PHRERDQEGAGERQRVHRGEEEQAGQGGGPDAAAGALRPDPHARGGGPPPPPRSPPPAPGGGGGSPLRPEPSDPPRSKTPGNRGKITASACPAVYRSAMAPIARPRSPSRPSSRRGASG